MSAVPLITSITPEEYLERERAAEFKSDYYGGQMYAMAGTSYNHAIITGNLVSELRQALRKTSCTVAPSDLRVRVSPEGLYTYPDVVVVCDPKFADDQQDTLLNPVLIVEVLSKSTELYDRTVKSTQYRKLESLQQFALVSQYVPHIEIMRRGPEGWMISDADGTDAVCRFDSVGCAIRLADIYEKVPLAPSPQFP